MSNDYISVHHGGFLCLFFDVFDRKLPKKVQCRKFFERTCLFVRQKSGESVLAIFWGDASARVSLVSDENAQNLSLCQKLFLVFLKF